MKDIDFLSYYFLALAELKEGNYSKSVDLYRKALELKPCDPGALTFLGQSLLGSIRDSISYVKISGLFDHYISLCENAASLRYFKGVLYNEIGLLDSALYYFGEVKTLDNEFYYHLQARVLTAEILMKIDDFPNAIKTLLAVKKMEPRWPYTYLYMGHYYRRIGVFEEAKENYFKLCEKGNEISAYYELTLLCLQFKKIEEAEEYLITWHRMALERGHISNSYLANIYYYYAWLNISKNDLALAKAYLEKSISLDADDDRYKNLYSSIEMALKNYDEVHFEYVRVY